MRTTRRGFLKQGMIGAGGLIAAYTGVSRVFARGLGSGSGAGSGISYSTNGAPFPYDGAAAASYADQYALTDVDESVSGSLILRHGDDCTNFASNCLYAGGMPMSDGWYSQQAGWPLQYFADHGYSTAWYHTDSWTVAPALYQYLAANQLAAQVNVFAPGAPLPAYNGLVPGDLVFFDWGNSQHGSGITHVVVQTMPGYDGNGNAVDLVDAHSNARLQVPWYLPDNQDASTTTIYCVHILGNTAVDITY